MYKLKDKISKSLIVILAVFLILSNFCLWLIIDSDAQYTNFHSPDTSEEFVVKETRHSEVYQLMKFKILSKKLADIRGDDGYRMFADHKYKLEWLKHNRLKINYLFDPIKPNDYQAVIIKYRKD